MPKQSFHRWIGVLLLAPLLAWSQPSPPAPEAAVLRQVIEAQLDAFQHDDAQRAFSFASPRIREQLGSAENFLRMVRTSYPVVYRPHSVRFEAFKVIDDQVFQPVRMFDADGQAWIALYGMERQPDGSWRIDGCELGRLVERET